MTPEFIVLDRLSRIYWNLRQSVRNQSPRASYTLLKFWNHLFGPFFSAAQLQKCIFPFCLCRPNAQVHAYEGANTCLLRIWCGKCICPSFPLFSAAHMYTKILLDSCTRLVSSTPALDSCTRLVYSTRVLDSCNRLVYSTFVLDSCTGFVYWTCVLDSCTRLV